MPLVGERADDRELGVVPAARDELRSALQPGVRTELAARIRAAVDGVIIASAVLLLGSGVTLAIDAIQQLIALKS